MQSIAAQYLLNTLGKKGEMKPGMKKTTEATD